MSIHIMSSVWRMSFKRGESDRNGLARKMVMLALSDNASDEGFCWPSISTIAAKCDLSRSTVFKVLFELEEMKLLERSTRGAGKHTGNQYQINLEVVRSADPYPSVKRTTPVRSTDPNHHITVNGTSSSSKEDSEVWAKASRSPVQPDLLSGNGDDLGSVGGKKKPRKLKTVFARACEAAGVAEGSELALQLRRMQDHNRENGKPLSFSEMKLFLDAGLDLGDVGLVARGVSVAIAKASYRYPGFVFEFRDRSVALVDSVESDEVPLTIEEKDALYIERWGKRYEALRDRLLGEGKSREFAVTVPGEVLENEESGGNGD